MISLPENWNELNDIEKQKFFCRYYAKFGRNGEIVGLHDWTPEEVKDAYKQWKEEKHGRA